MKRLRALGFVAVVCLANSAEYGEDTKLGVAADAPLITFKGHAAAVTRLAYSLDSRRVASFSKADVYIWEAATGKKLWSMMVGRADSAAFSHDLKSLAIARFDRAALREKVTLHDLLNGHEPFSWEPHVIWDRKSPYMFRPLTAALAFSPDGRRLAAAGSLVKTGGAHGLPGGVVTLWDTETGKELWHFDRLSTIADTLAFSRDGKYLAAGTWGAESELPEPGEAVVWNAETGELVQTFKVKSKIDWNESLYSVLDLAFDPGSKRLATALSDGTVRLWELSSGREIINLRAHFGDPIAIGDPQGVLSTTCKPVLCVAFSPDGSRLAAAGCERVVRMWYGETGGEMNEIRWDVPWITTLAFSADGREVAAGGGTTKSGEVSIWRLARE